VCSYCYCCCLVGLFGVVESTSPSSSTADKKLSSHQHVACSNSRTTVTRCVQFGTPCVFSSRLLLDRAVLPCTGGLRGPVVAAS
jgi:hypothetical protein